jgi:hypothetical protein
MLATGSVIEPGNWGRMLRLYTPQAQPNSWLLVRELVYEGIRRAHYSAKPSRIVSTFLCLTESDIQEFRIQYNRNFDLMYEVEIIDQNAPRHIGDWTLPNMANTDTVQVFELRAHLYWQGNDAMKQEIVTPSPVRILRRL